jgi:hypothetical protein
MGRSTVLASTCQLYGNYRAIRLALIAANIPFEDCSAKAWQGWFKMRKSRGEGNTQWKNRLKEKAQATFPDQRVTLATADALLIAAYTQQVLEAAATAGARKKRGT